jgi:hypothetical protein
MRPTMLALCLPLASLAGCAALSPDRVHADASAAREPVDEGSAWRGIARPADQQRIDTIDAQWASALSALPARLRPRTAADRQLLDPQAARALPAIPPGGYQCRRVRLGGRARLTRFKPDTCYVKLDGDRLSFTAQTGSLMPGGWLYPDGDRRVVLLATDRPAKVSVAPPYGVDADRDLAGLIERIGPLRWRLTIPRAASLDIWELKPWPEQGTDD